MLSRINSVVWMDDERENPTNNKKGDEINSLSTFKSILELEEDTNNNWYENDLTFSSNNLLLQPVDSSSSCSPSSASVFQNFDQSQLHFFLPPKPTISSLLNPISNNPLEESFDLGFETGFLAMNRGMHGFCDLGSQTQMGVSSLTSNTHFSTTHLLQFPGNGFGTPDFPGLDDGSTGDPLFFSRSKLLKPLDNSASTGAQPTLFQKRAALRRNLSEIKSGGEGNLGVLGEDTNEKKNKKSSIGSWDDVDNNLGFDGSCLNYDSDAFTVNNTSNFEENGVKIGGGNSSNANSTVTGGDGGGGGDQKGKTKGLPAKNLMAERRRRKKLNDRLYMLRSVVPKISKMDRASILGDAIEYLKELLQKINDINHELESTPSSSSLTPTTTATTAATGFYPLTPSPTTLPSRIKEELCPSALPSPTGQPARVEVRQREGRAVNIHMFCSRRPGLLLSTMRALDNLGLDIQQAVISCFNGFALDIFRAEQCKEGQDVHPDQVKAMLLDAAGYHGVA